MAAMAATLDFRSERLKLFFIYKSPSCFLLSFKSIGPHGGHLGFPIGMILTGFDLQVTPMLATKFQVIWPFSSREEAENRF